MTNYLNSDNFQRLGYRQIFINLGLLIALFLPVHNFAHGQGVSASAGSNTIGDQQKKRVESLTLQLNQTINVYHGAENAAEKSGIEEKLIALAEERRELLLEIISIDPVSTTSLALQQRKQVGLPLELQELFEQKKEIDGTLKIYHEDYKDKSLSQYVHILTTEQGKPISLHFTDHLPGFQSGVKVRVKGLYFPGINLTKSEKTEGAMVLDKAQNQIVYLDAPGTGGKKGGGKNNNNNDSNGSGQVIGEHKTLVILVSPQDNPIEPYSVSYAQEIMFGTTNDYFLENSFQQMWLSGDVAGWFAIPTSSNTCDTASIATEAKAAASAAGYNLNDYVHHVIAFPQNNNCGFWGRSSVGGNPSTAWINGELKLGVTAHELGHSIGLYHSHSKECGLNSIDNNCTHIEYGDIADMMGSSSFAHFNPFQKERLGWLGDSSVPPIATITTSGTYTINDYVSDGSGPKALKVAKSIDPNSGQQVWYYIHARQSSGFDTDFVDSNYRVLNGILIHTGTDANANSSFLLDMSPESGDTAFKDWQDLALEVGQTYEDIDEGISITAEWVNETGAGVTVSFGNNPVASDLAVETDQSSYTLNQNVTVYANATSGGAPIANASITFSVLKPNGDSFANNATTDSNGIAEYKFRLKRQDPVGIYTTTAEVNGGSVNKASTDFMVN